MHFGEDAEKCAECEGIGYHKVVVLPQVAREGPGVRSQIDAWSRNDGWRVLRRSLKHGPVPLR